MTPTTGSCLCGALSYSISAEAVVSRICWCRDCQHISSNGTVNAIFPSDAIAITGTPAEYTSTAQSGNQVKRRFCAACGSHLFADSSARPNLTGVRMGTLHQPSQIKPSANIWASSAPVWACLDPALERLEHQPPAPVPRPAG